MKEILGDMIKCTKEGYGDDVAKNQTDCLKLHHRKCVSCLRNLDKKCNSDNEKVEIVRKCFKPTIESVQSKMKDKTYTEKVGKCKQ